MKFHNIVELVRYKVNNYKGLRYYTLGFAVESSKDGAMKAQLFYEKQGVNQLNRCDFFICFSLILSILH